MRVLSLLPRLVTTKHDDNNACCWSGSWHVLRVSSAFLVHSMNNQEYLGACRICATQLMPGALLRVAARREWEPQR